jgi:hypothetical protein
MRSVKSSVIEGKAAREFSGSAATELAQVICGSEGRPRMQSVLAMMFSPATSSANVFVQSSTNSGCSAGFVAWLKNTPNQELRGNEVAFLNVLNALASQI